MLHLYALIGADAEPPPGEGIDGCPLSVVPLDRFHAVVSDHAHRPSATVDAVVTHARVVESFVSRVPTLPIRFGSSHTGMDRLAEVVATSLDDLEEALERVAGSVEFVVRPHPHAPSSRAGDRDDADGTRSPTAPGRTYLERRATVLHEREQVEQRAWQDVEAATAPLLAHTSRVRRVRGRSGPECCFLVPLAEVDAFERAARDIERYHPVIVRGAYPAFTFGGAP